MRAVVLALLMLVSPAWAAEWELNHEGDQRGEVTTYVREVSDSPVKAFKGVVELKASTTSVLAVITAVDTFPEWIFQSQGAERLTMEEKERIHMRFNGIWPVADRDVVLANTLTQQADGEIHLHSENADGFKDKQQGFVRIPALDNQFVITPLADGWVRVKFETFVDPGGNVPVWLANLVSTRAPLVTLEGLKAQLQKPQFANATREDLPGLPGMEVLKL
ncbi:MAG: START domain-containing protein [Alcanivorax sp.]|uniref:START domain-containing protein n=1 Tax=Alcanivorax sp. TaxID=1872427 RepID=UPI003DA768E5